MKVVINNEHGGFSLSRKAFLRLRELGEDTALHEPDYGEMWEDGSGPRKPFGNNDKGSFCREIPRDSHLLIEIIEELGKEASGGLASLKFVEIPDGTEWCIEEYDGREWIAEKHETWA